MPDGLAIACLALPLLLAGCGVDPPLHASTYKCPSVVLPRAAPPAAVLRPCPALPKAPRIGIGREQAATAEGAYIAQLEIQYENCATRFLILRNGYVRQ